MPCPIDPVPYVLLPIRARGHAMRSSELSSITCSLAKLATVAHPGLLNRSGGPAGHLVVKAGHTTGTPPPATLPVERAQQQRGDARWLDMI